MFQNKTEEMKLKLENKLRWKISWKVRAVSEICNTKCQAKRWLQIIFQRAIHIGLLFLKYGPIPTSFCLFSSFSHSYYNFNNTNWKRVDGVLGIWTRGRRIVGADETKDLWQPLIIYFCSFNVTEKCYETVALAQWIRLGMQSCGPVFESQAYHQWLPSPFRVQFYWLSLGREKDANKRKIVRVWAIVNRMLCSFWAPYLCCRLKPL